MKIIIAGSRDFNNKDLLFKEVSAFLETYCLNHQDIEIVTGGAKGADRLGEEYARYYNIKLKTFPANWDLYGISAGPIRNQEMAKYSDALIAFWDGKSRGTKDMIIKAKRNLLLIKIIKY